MVEADTGGTYMRDVDAEANERVVDDLANLPAAFPGGDARREAPRLVGDLDAVLLPQLREKADVLDERVHRSVRIGLVVGSQLVCGDGGSEELCQLGWETGKGRRRT